MLLPYPYSYVTDEDFGRDTMLKKFIRSRFVAACLLLIACLQPIEAFSMQCQSTSMVCTDSTPCKSIGSATVCLSTVPAALMPPGALQSTQPCWTSSGVYSCVNPTGSLTDTCGVLAADPNCGKVNAVCANTDPTTGACTTYTDTYQCQTGGGATTTGTDCSGQTFCTDGTCFTKKDKPNNALVKVVTAAEVTRLAGFYADPATLTAFSGQSSWCTQNTLGLANCCKPNPAGASATNALLTNELIKAGWNAWIKEAVGSSYTFDTLFDSTKPYVKRAYNGMMEVLDGKSFSNGWNVKGASPNGTQGGKNAVPTNNAGASVGGYVGGMIGQQVGSSLFANNGGNTIWTGIGGAAGYAAGTAAGTYVGGGVYSMAGGGAFTPGVVDPYSLMIVFAVMVIMALLACDIPEIKTQLRLGANICHFVGSYCSAKVLGACTTTRNQYCCFNSKLAKIIQEQGRPQLNRGWGTAVTPDCGGLTVAELGALDFSKMDFTEFMNDVTAKANPDPAKISREAMAKTSAFFANTANPSATYGVVPRPAAGTPPPAITILQPVTPPAMPTCAFTVNKAPMAANGDQSGSVSLTACLANGTAVFDYMGTCLSIPNGFFADVKLDANGAGILQVPLIPGSCKTSTNGWSAKIIDTGGTNLPVGTISVTW